MWTDEQKREYQKKYYAENKELVHKKYDQKRLSFLAHKETWCKLRFRDLLALALQLQEENERLATDLTAINLENIKLKYGAK